MLALVALVSAVLGVLAFARYRSSERYIKAELAAIEKQGRSLEVEACVDTILGWHKRCKAMAGLCQAAVSRLMGVCFRAQDRRAYCRGLKQSTTDTRFGYAECKARGVKRHAKKACSGMYRVIDSHCHALKHGSPSWASPTARSAAPVQR